MTEIANRIAPAEVTRDKYGLWSHPDLPEFDEDCQAYLDWLDSQQLDLRNVSFEYDASDDLLERWYEAADPTCRDWQPEQPEGKGWFMLGIWEDDDGPWCAWVRYREANADRENLEAHLVTKDVFAGKAAIQACADHFQEAWEHGFIDRSEQDMIDVTTAIRNFAETYQGGKE